MNCKCQSCVCWFIATHHGTVVRRYKGGVEAMHVDAQTLACSAQLKN